MIANLIQTLIQHLPRYAEEEGDFYSVTRDNLIHALCQHHDIERCVAENTVYLCENLLDTLATLNTDYLQRGEWCFVSFPAQLMALSLLTAMSDAGSRFFDARFWNTQGISDAKKESQLAVLSAVENRRSSEHLQQFATPIRYIYVAWSLIKIDGKILFYQREDTKKRHDAKAGDYGLVGGRLNQRDMLNFSGDLREKLLILQSSNYTLIKLALIETLKRELHEELGLIYPQHYEFKLWRSLKPYRQVQGAAPNHALTEYFLDIFSISLTLEGFCWVQQKVQQDERLVWFTLDEMVNGNTLDGKKAFIQALFDDFDNDRNLLKQCLSALNDSFLANYCFNAEKYGVTFSLADQALLAGVFGKESVVAISLSQPQLLLLLGLAAHGRGFAFNHSSRIVFHPFGWLEVPDNSELQVRLIQLAEICKEAPVIVENNKDCWFRLSVSPEIIYFDDAFFSCSVKKSNLDSRETKIPVRIKRREIKTDLGSICEQELEVVISLQLAHDLHKLKLADYLIDTEFASKVRDNYRKSQLHEKFLNIGMRGLIRQDRGMLKMCGGFIVD